MNTNTFRESLRAVANTLGQSELSRLSGVEQYNISKFLKGEREILLSNALKLWPFVYGTESCPPEDAPHAPEA